MSIGKAIVMHREAGVIILNELDFGYQLRIHTYQDDKIITFFMVKQELVDLSRTIDFMLKDESSEKSLS